MITQEIPDDEIDFKSLANQYLEIRKDFGRLKGNSFLDEYKGHIAVKIFLVSVEIELENKIA